MGARVNNIGELELENEAGPPSLLGREMGTPARAPAGSFRLFMDQATKLLQLSLDGQPFSPLVQQSGLAGFATQAFALAAAAAAGAGAEAAAAAYTDAIAVATENAAASYTDAESAAAQAAAEAAAAVYTDAIAAATETAAEAYTDAAIAAFDALINVGSVIKFRPFKLPLLQTTGNPLAVSTTLVNGDYAGGIVFATARRTDVVGLNNAARAMIAVGRKSGGTVLQAASASSLASGNGTLFQASGSVGATVWQDVSGQLGLGVTGVTAQTHEWDLRGLWFRFGDA